MLVISYTCGQAWPSDGIAYAVDEDFQRPYATRLWHNWSEKADLFWSVPPGPLVLTVDYRLRTLCNSSTTKQWGMSMPTPAGSPPESRLVFPMNSVWHGFRIGVEETDRCAAHIEWLTPQKAIQGNHANYTWQSSDPEFTDLDIFSEQWSEGQMLDLGYEFRLLERPLGLRFDVWPTIGFRWQRLNLMCNDGYQVKYADQWLDPPVARDGDVVIFNQQYSMGYAGLQLRGKFDSGRLPPIALTLQADAGFTTGYNVGRDLLHDGNWYAMQTTYGDCWHVGLTAEALFCRERLSVGFQLDYLGINTQGKHHWLNTTDGIDEAWSNGVSVSSRQTWLTAFLRMRF